MAKKATTLFIRDNSINLLVMKGRQIDKWASTSLEPGLVSQGLIVDEDGVAELVRQLFRQEKVSTDRVITALSGHDSLYRIITLPDVPDAVLPEAVRREAKRTIPTPLDEVYVSYQSVPSMKGERRVFLATYPRNSVDAMIRTLRKAGIKPYVMDLAPLALCRIPDLPRSIIINARLDHLEVMVIADRLPQVIRRLSLPGETESLEEKLPLIAEEFTRTFTFYNSSHMENPLDSTVPVFVCGDLAEAPDTWESLVAEQGNSVAALPPPIAEVPEGFDPDQFMVNIGLALKELLTDKEGAEFSVINFNALPETYLPKHFSVARVVIPVGIVIGIAAVVFGAVLVLHTRAQIDDLRPRVETEEGHVVQYQRDIASLRGEIGPMDDTARALDSRISAMEMRRAEIAIDLREIHRLAHAITPLSLTEVVHRVDRVIVEGRATDCTYIYDYARELRNSGRFSAIRIHSFDRDNRQYDFELDLSK